MQNYETLRQQNIPMKNFTL